MSAYRAALLALFVVGASVATFPASATGGADDATPGANAASGASATGAAADVPRSGSSHSAPDSQSESPTDASGATHQNDSSGTTTGNDTSAANDSAFGADISSFMQSSAAEVGGAVETGMWTAAYDDTDNRSVRVRLVERRTGDLREELTDLEERKQELVAEREAGAVNEAAYKARIGQLVGQINALRDAIDATETRAREVNADVAAIADLRTETENLSGPEIASVARNLTGVGERGPPNGVGNGEAGPPGDETTVGNGADEREVGGNRTGQRGPPNDVGGEHSRNATSGEQTSPLA